MVDYIKNIIDDMKREQSYVNSDTLTVEEVLKLPTLQGYRVIAGESGLKKRCRHMTILETPTGISWLEGEEFLVTAGYAFVNNDENKSNMIKEASCKGVSAIAIKENRYFGDVSEELIAQANEYEIPIILIPYDVVYTRTISSFYNMIFYRKNEYILNLNNIYEKLLNLSFENKNIDEIVKSLSDLSSSNIFLINKSFNVLNSCLINRGIEDKTIEFSCFDKDVKDLLRDGSCKVINKKINSFYTSIYPINSENKIIAYLIVFNDSFIDKLSLSSIEYGLSIIALKLEMDKASQTARNNVNRSLVEIILYKKDLPDDFYQNIEYDLNWDTDGFIACTCINLHAINNHPLENYIKDIYNYLNDILKHINFLSINNNNNIFIFSKYESNVNLEDFVANLYGLMKPHKNYIKVSIGVSNPHYHLKETELMRDESYLASLFIMQGIAYYNSLDTIRLLYPLKDDKEIQEYYKKTIMKLEKYDELNDSDLVKTLETYFRYNLKKSVVSEKLFIHVETLRYRLNKVEEITGYSVNDAEGLFALQMGIKLKSLIKLK